MKSVIIGIAGGSGSGKSTFTNRIKQYFGDDVAVIYHDNYYRRQDGIPFEERVKVNYDHPDSLETDLLVEHLKKLKDGRVIECPVYDYKVHNRSRDTITVAPSKVIIVEGILIFENKELCDMMDVRVFVDTDSDIRLIRRLQRDVLERARSLESVINQYMNTVKPMHEQFVEPSKKNANIIIPEGGYNKTAMEMLQNHINSHLKRTADL